MDKHIKWGILVSAAAFIFMCGSIGYLALHVAHKIPDLTATVKALDATLDHVNKPCKGSGKDKADNCGTLALAGQVLVDSGDLIKRSDAVEDKETAMLNIDLPKLFSSINGTVTNLGDTATALKGTANAATGTLDATTGTVKSAQPLLDNASTFVADLNTETKPVMTHADLFFADADAIASNPDIAKTIANTQLITYNFGQTSTDFQTKFHLLLFPPPCKTFGCKLARAYPYVKGVAEMGEASYWTSQLFQNSHP